MACTLELRSAHRLASQRGATGRMISQRLRALTTLTALAMAVPTGSLPAAASSPGGGGDRRPSSSADQAAPVKLIIDTDMGSDVSNLISVCSVNAMMDRGEVELLAVMTSTGQPAAIGAVSAANNFYGHNRVLLGAYKGVLATDQVCTICKGPYLANLVANFSGPVTGAGQVRNLCCH